MSDNFDYRMLRASIPFYAIMTVAVNFISINLANANGSFLIKEFCENEALTCDAYRSTDEFFYNHSLSEVYAYNQSITAYAIPSFASLLSLLLVALTASCCIDPVAIKQGEKNFKSVLRTWGYFTFAYCLLLLGPVLLNADIMTQQICVPYEGKPDDCSSTFPNMTTYALERTAGLRNHVFGNILIVALNFIMISSGIIFSCFTLVSCSPYCFFKRGGAYERARMRAAVDGLDVDDQDSDDHAAVELAPRSSRRGSRDRGAGALLA